MGTTAATVSFAIVLASVASASIALGDPSPVPTASAAPAASSTASPAAAGSGIAFDQIDRIISGTGTPPPLNGFSADLAAIQKYQTTTFGPSSSDIAQSMATSLAEEALSIINPFAAAAAAAAAQARARAQQRRYEEQMKTMMGPNPGTYSRYFFYNRWIRIEVSGLVLILKPDQHLKILLNPSKKTYRALDTATPAPAPEPSETTPPNPAKAGLVVSTTQTDSANVAGQTANGYRSDAALTLTGGIDPCVDGTYRVSQLEYFAPFAEPLPGAAAEAQAFYALALPSYCNVRLTPQLTGAAPPYGQLYAYRLVTVVRDEAAARQPASRPNGTDPQAAMQAMFGTSSGPGSNYMKLSERSNIRKLGASDAALFDIPAGYSETK